MKRALGIIVAGGALILLFGAAVAHWEGRYGGPEKGSGIGYGMGYGHGMGWGGGHGHCPRWGDAATTAAPLDADTARELAQDYADAYLQGFKVDKVLPFTGRQHTAYAVELKNADGELRTFHVNPFGTVVQFGRPWRRGS